MFLTTRKLFVAMLFLALFVMTTREISDPDFWWHLRTGEYIVETQSIPHTDLFSFTNLGRPWVTHEWLAEVFLYALYRIGAFPLLIVAFSAILTGSFALVYARCDGKPYGAASALALAALATAPTWGVRPQMLSLLLMCVFLWVLDRALDPHPNLLPKRAKGYWLWLLPPLMVLWVNLHSGYALGLAIIAVYLFGEIVARITSQRSNRSTIQLTGVFILCLLAVLLNPNGATMYTYPFETLTSPTMQAYIQEWFSPDFHQIEFQPFAGLLLATFAAIALSGKRATLTQTLLLVGTAYAGLRSARNMPLFAVVAAPILAEHLWYIVGSRFGSTNKTNQRMTRGMAIVNWILLAIIALAGLLRVVMVVSNQNEIERAKFPAAAVDFLLTQEISGGIFNTYDWGGYLIWRFAARPQARVFIDGRADVYGDQFIEQEYLLAYRGGADWRAPLDRYNVRVVLIEPAAPLAARLASDATWKKVYADKQAVVWERK